MREILAILLSATESYIHIIKTQSIGTVHQLVVLLDLTEVNGFLKILCPMLPSKQYGLMAIMPIGE